MTILGAILAGGQARRFGADKALAALQGMTLIDRIAATIGPQVDAVVIVGRGPGIADRPAGIGPLGGIAAALHDARSRGFGSVVTVPCDTPMLPADLVVTITRPDQATFVAGLPVIGGWPASLADVIDAYIAATTDWSIRAWARHVGAVPIVLDATIANINTRADLAALAATVSGSSCS